MCCTEPAVNHMNHAKHRSVSIDQKSTKTVLCRLVIIYQLPVSERSDFIDAAAVDLFIPGQRSGSCGAAAHPARLFLTLLESL